MALAGLVFGAAMISNMARSTAGSLLDGKISVGADFRARFEADFSSQRASGDKREDRNRARIRSRISVNFKINPAFEIGARFRTGSDLSQQSPHITVADFDGNDTGDADFIPDKWYLKVKVGKAWGWVGRNSFPFWKQNEFFWDDDVTPAGLAGGFKADLGSLNLALNGGYFSLPAGMQEFAGNLGAGQVVVTSRLGSGSSVTLAAGWFGFDGDADDPDTAILRKGNAARDYSIFVANLQFKTRLGGHPLVLGLDYMHNSEDYSAAELAPFPATEGDQDDAFVVSLKYGRTKKQGEWLAAYYYARIETLAVNASFAQDDWVRFGSATQTDSSDLKGHEFRLAYALTDKSNLVARLYIVDAVTTIQDGNRFRLDYNIKF